MKGWKLVSGGCETFWIDAVPTGWSRPALWLDPVAGRVVTNSRTGAISTQAPAEGVLYAPPVADADRQRRTRLLEDWSRAGHGVVVHQRAGEDAEPNQIGALTIWDPTVAIFSGLLRKLPLPAAGWWVVWPLFAGITDDEATLQSFCRRAKKAGAAGVYPMATELDPKGRRQLADLYGGASFSALHHGRVDVRRAARAIAAEDMPFQVPRPPLGGESGVHAQALTSLAWAGDLLLQLGDAEKAQRLLRAQRWLQTAPWDAGTLVREQHIDLVPELAGEPGEVVRQVADTGTSTLLDDARQHYLATSTNHQH